VEYGCTEFKTCQSDDNDPRNRMGTAVGATCLGVTPAFAWQSRFFFPNCVDDADCRAFPHLFGKCCHQKDPAAFRNNTINLYITRRVGPAGCADLTWPAFFVCADVAVVQGYVATMQLLDALPYCKNWPLTGPCEPVQHCTSLNNLLLKAVSSNSESDFGPMKERTCSHGAAELHSLG